MRTFKEILSELGERLDDAFTIKEIVIDEFDYMKFIKNNAVKSIKKIGKYSNDDIVIVTFDDTNSRLYRFNNGKFISVGLNIVTSLIYVTVNSLNDYKLVGSITGNNGYDVDHQAAKI
jgi:hypothetical protein